MGLADRDYMRRTPAIGRPPSGNGPGWQKILWIGAVVIGLGGAGLYLYKDIRESFTPSEGDLIVNVNTATQGELETIPGIGHFAVNSIRPYVKVQGETEKR